MNIPQESWGRALRQGAGLRCFTLPSSFVEHEDEEEDDFPMDEEYSSQDDDEPIGAEPTQCHNPSAYPSSTEEAVHTPSGYRDYPTELRHMSTTLRTFAELVMEEISRDDFQEVRFLYCEHGARDRRRMLKYVLMIDTEAETGEPRYIPYWERCTTDEEAFLESWS
ncbi:hypothetical protein NLI96_g8904 [Meripilus lineatus]|uniref:Uncharacterized protein n=1 Tax=Meripilus lineatus TaxID=2056292 RepID=A0AAD5YFV4_9APHY|nr:hypothetical protein NLI96_g8904 [Physisporinus lineatus]